MPLEIRSLFSTLLDFNQYSLASPLTCSRAATVQELASILDENRVVNVRGTPASGKSVLAGLLHRYYLEQNIPAVLIMGWPQNRTHNYKVILVHEAANAGLALSYQSLHDADIVFILDEAQMSWGDYGLWLGLIKSQSGRAGREGPRIALFSSYGSPEGGPPENQYGSGSLLGFFGVPQRVGITSSSLEDSPNISLFYSREEFQDVVALTCQNEQYLKLDQSAQEYLFNLTSGHPGAVDGILRMLMKLYRSELISGRQPSIEESHIRKTFCERQVAFKHLKYSAVHRSFVDPTKLTPEARHTLRKVLFNGSIIRDMKDPGISTCYKIGWIHTEALDSSSSHIICVLPTNLHAMYIEFELADRHFQFPCERFPDIASLAEATIRSFSRRNLQATSQSSRTGPGAIKRPLEATYQDEFYRAIHHVLGYSADITSEWSPDGLGRIDFRLGSMRWGFELLREGDRLTEHCQRFVVNGSYSKWITNDLLRDWLIIDFRTSRPKPYISKYLQDTPTLAEIAHTSIDQSNTRLWHVLFVDNFSEAEILDQDNNTIVSQICLTG
ncbi:hypothetical protein N7495_001371 [Penicillium taxi]|uniref:uncharacterized protein n=1 Tax=Penicillium taxi TaxID=168475 RepID=UPI0025452632|nr:uncharacterized protein N7495_001371 [Penicillium taxi]KAJ5908689.1 hypothetical protein N7495_001371 [Penicillium taxi]